MRQRGHCGAGEPEHVHRSVDADDAWSLALVGRRGSRLWNHTSIVSAHLIAHQGREVPAKRLLSPGIRPRMKRTRQDNPVLGSVSGLTDTPNVACNLVPQVDPTPSASASGLPAAHDAGAERSPAPAWGGEADATCRQGHRSPACVVPGCGVSAPSLRMSRLSCSVTLPCGASPTPSGEAPRSPFCSSVPDHVASLLCHRSG